MNNASTRHHVLPLCCNITWLNKLKHNIMMNQVKEINHLKFLLSEA